MEGGNFPAGSAFGRCAGVDLQHSHFVGHRITPHFHDDYQIAVIVEGALTLRVQGAESVLTPLAVAAINPGDVHSGFGGTLGWRCRNFYVPRLFVEGLQLNESFASFQSPSIDNVDLARSLAEAHQVCLVEGDGALAAETLLTTALGDLFAQQARNHPSATIVGSRTSSHHAADYIHANFSRKISLSEFAQVAGLSRYHFIRTFARDVGLTPHAYQVQIRLQFARKRLAQGALAADVAVEAGFADQSHLIRELRRTLGLTPLLIQRAAT